MNHKDDFTNRLILGLIQGNGIPFLARHLAQVLNRPIIITNAVHRILIFHNPLALNITVDEFVTVPSVKINEEDLLASSVDLLKPGQLHIEDTAYPFVYLPLCTNGLCLGYCIILDASPSDEDWHYIRQTALVLLLSLGSKRNSELAQIQLRDEFIRDILYNNYDSKISIYEKAKMWQWDLQGPLSVLVIDCKPGKIETVRDLVPEQINHQSPITAVINDQLAVILKVQGWEKSQQRAFVHSFLTEFLAQLKKNDLDCIRVGVGSSVSAVTDLYKSYQEAKIAWELGKIFDQNPVCYFEEMGFLKFIFTHSAMELQEFSQRILGPVQNEDLETEAGLMDTLRAFLDNKCQVPESSKALYVHENTLRNRLKKIERLTGYDLRRIDHLVNIYIALQILNSGKDS